MYNIIRSLVRFILEIFGYNQFEINQILTDIEDILDTIGIIFIILFVIYILVKLYLNWYDENEHKM